jgi:cytochrome c oxidase subunit 3
VIAALDAPRAQRNRELALLLVLATVVMLFAGFAAALLVRRTADDWRPISLPPLMGWTTAVLLGSSAALARAVRAGSPDRWLVVAALAGLAFLAGQLVALAAWAEHGVPVTAGPYAAFVYALAGVHAVHVGGGLAALAATRHRPPAFALAATYWHFMGGVWCVLLALLALA